MKNKLMTASLLALLVNVTSLVYGQESSKSDLAKATQNPVSDLISLPFQNNTNFNFGPAEGTQNILNIQPVWPIALNEKWNLVTRTIVPVTSQPPFAAAQDRTTGLGDTTFTAFLSLRRSHVPFLAGKL